MKVSAPSDEESFGVSPTKGSTDNSIKAPRAVFRPQSIMFTAPRHAAILILLHNRILAKLCERKPVGVHGIPPTKSQKATHKLAFIRTFLIQSPMEVIFAARRTCMQCKARDAAWQSGQAPGRKEASDTGIVFQGGRNVISRLSPLGRIARMATATARAVYSVVSGYAAGIRHRPAATRSVEGRLRCEWTLKYLSLPAA